MHGMMQVRSCPVHPVHLANTYAPYTRPGNRLPFPCADDIAPLFLTGTLVPSGGQDACALISLESGFPAANSPMLLIVVSQMVEIASRVKNA